MNLELLLVQQHLPMLGERGFVSDKKLDYSKVVGKGSRFQIKEKST